MLFRRSILVHCHQHLGKIPTGNFAPAETTLEAYLPSVGCESGGEVPRLVPLPAAIPSSDRSDRGPVLGSAWRNKYNERPGESS